MSGPHEKKDSAGYAKTSCKLCNGWYHRVDIHLEKKHGDITPEEYLRRFPTARLLSEAGEEMVRKEKTSEAREEHSALEKKPKKAAEPPKSAKAKKPGDRGSVKPAKAEEKPEEVGPEIEGYKLIGIDMGEEEIEEPGVAKFGVGRLPFRTDVPEEHECFVPEHDPHWRTGVSEIEKWEVISVAFADRENALLVGPTGCGKSESVFQLAAAIGQPVRRINMDSETRRADFIGDKTVDVDPATNQAVVKWVDGLLPDCMRNGMWLLIDEIDAAPAQILFVLQAVLEKHILTIPATGETIKPHEDFRIVATANTNGRGDETGLYTGTNVLNEAFLDRFGVVLKYDYPAPEVEAEIIFRKTGFIKEDCVKMVEIANDVRKAAEQETVYCTFSTRRLLQWASKSVKLGNVLRAAKFTVLNRLSADDAKVVGGLIQRKWGGASP